VCHWKRRIWLAVKTPGESRDRLPRRNFPNEDDTAPPAFGALATHVKMQINLLKIAVTGERNSEQPGAEKRNLTTLT
jgi:hypothetical protein